MQTLLNTYHSRAHMFAFSFTSLDWLEVDSFLNVLDTQFLSGCTMFEEAVTVYPYSQRFPVFALLE